MRSDPLNPFNYDRIWKATYGDQQSYGPVHRHMRRMVQQVLKTLDYKSVIDVGCGKGHNLDSISRNHTFKSYDGIDISRVAIRYCTDHLPGTFHQLDIQRNYLSKKADLVFCSLLLEHVIDHKKALHHLRHMSKKWLVITTIAGNINKYAIHEHAMGHVRNYRVGELERMIRNEGFIITQSIYWGFPFYSPIGRFLSNKTRITHRFNLTNRILSTLMYLIYYFNSQTQGDLLIVVAKRPGQTQKI